MISQVILAAALGVLAAPGNGPMPTEIYAPIYPEAAVKSRMVGAVRILFEIGGDGTVVAVHVLKGLNILMDTACLRAARLWRFEPGDQDTRLAEVTFTFVLRVDPPAAGKGDPGPTQVTICSPDSVVIRGWDRPPPPVTVY